MNKYIVKRLTVGDNQQIIIESVSDFKRLKQAKKDLINEINNLEDVKQVDRLKKNAFMYVIFNNRSKRTLTTTPFYRPI